MAADAPDTRRSVYLLLTAAAVAIAAAKVSAPRTSTSRAATRRRRRAIQFRTRRPAAEVAGRAARSDADVQLERQVPLGDVRSLVDEQDLRHRQADVPRRPKPEVYKDDGIVAEAQEPRHRAPTAGDERGARERVLFSKPPLLRRSLAGEYWLLKQLFGWSIVRDRWLVIPASC